MLLDGDAPPRPDRAPELFDAITEHRTNHRPYRTTTVPEPLLERFASDADAAGFGLELVTEPPRLDNLAALQTRADERQFENREYRTDTVGCNYVKIFGTPRCRNPSWAYSRQYELGYWIGTGALGANLLTARIGQLAVRHLDLGEREGRKNSKLVTSAPVVAVLTAEADDVETRLRAGQLFERMALTATSEGLAVHPMSQVLEVRDLRDELVELLDLDESRPLHLFRLGYADPDSTRTPRRSVKEVLE